MKHYKLLINSFAERDIVSSKHYYDAQKEGLGDEFLLELKRTIKSIENNPYLYPKIIKSARKASL